MRCVAGGGTATPWKAGSGRLRIRSVGSLGDVACSPAKKVSAERKKPSAQPRLDESKSVGVTRRSRCHVARLLLRSWILLDQGSS